MKIPFVDLKTQYASIKPEIDQAISDVIAETAFIGGKFGKRFEEDFAAFCGTRYAVGVSNGTDAVRLALLACGVGPGDEVITVPNTFIATTEAVSMTGARIRFVDVDEATSNMDPSLLEEAITPRTKAILPVHLYGHPADMDPILEIARRHGLKVVGDTAQAHGALYKDRPIATLCDVAAFSFYPGKNLGAYGDAGAIATDDEQIAALVTKLRDHGRMSKYEHDMEAFNCRLDGIQAAVLSVKLRYLRDWSEARRNVAAGYTRELSELEDVLPPVPAPWAVPVYHLYVARMPQRDRIRERLGEMGIATGIHYPIPLHLQPAYKHLGLGPGSFPVTERLANEIVSLPIFPELSEERLQYVTGSLRTVLAERTSAVGD